MIPSYKIIKNLLISIFLTVFIYMRVVDAQEKRQILNNRTILPLTFTENSGQLNPEVKFSTKINGCTLFFTKEGVTYSFVKAAKDRAEKELYVVQRCKSRFYTMLCTG